MSQVAKLFMNGRSQAVRLPVAFRFNADEVFIRQDPETGDVILSRKPESLAAFFAALEGVDVMPWNETVSEHYAHIRATLVRQGKTLTPLDLLIAAHAISIGAVLVTNDQAFRLLDSLRLEDWTEAVS